MQVATKTFLCGSYYFVVVILLSYFLFVKILCFFVLFIAVAA